MAEKALEGPLKVYRSPRIFHLATHAFYLENQMNNFKGIDLFDLHSHDRMSASNMENPLLRSGLALAGADTFVTGGRLPPEAEDGIINALDVTGWDLFATELAVIAACFSGRGDIHIGEGVMGLRRAFILAGARSLVMNLWRADDLASAILMDRFYTNLRWRGEDGQGMDRDLALSEARQYVRTLPASELQAKWLTRKHIEERVALLPQEKQKDARFELNLLAKGKLRGNFPYSAPYYWAGWVLIGETRPLEFHDSQHQ